MKLVGMLPYRTALYGLLFMSLVKTVVGFGAIIYCSPENNGLGDYVGYAHYQSWGLCAGNCTGYAFGILQDHDCWCSNYIPAQQEDIYNCGQACPGFGSESCGNSDTGLFGYLQLGPAAYGTSGTSSTSSAPSTTSQQYTSTTYAPSTTYIPPATTTSSVYTTPSSSPAPDTTSYVSVTITSIVTESSHHSQWFETVTKTQRVSVPESHPATSSSSSYSSHSQYPSHSTSPTTRVTVITQSGAHVTETVTYTPTTHHHAAATSTNANPPLTGNSSSHHQALSDGATAGIVIGAIAGLALILALAWLLWRRRRAQQASAQESEPGEQQQRRPKRTTSVLSRTGLLSRGRQSMIENHYDDAAGSYTGGGGAGGNTTASTRHSLLFGSGGAGGGSTAAGTAAAAGAAGAGAAAADAYNHPSSPLGSSHGEDAGFGAGGSNFTSGAAGAGAGVAGAAAAAGGRRSSKPLVYDQRLNPSVLFANHDNGSRVSMQDNNDYSRPLGIANPDPRPSYESRRSGWD